MVGVLGNGVALQATYHMMRPHQETDGTENWVTEGSYNAGGRVREPSILAPARTELWHPLGVEGKERRLFLGSREGGCMERTGGGCGPQ